MVVFHNSSSLRPLSIPPPLPQRQGLDSTNNTLVYMQDLGFSQKSLQITSYLHAIPSSFLLIETSQQAGFICTISTVSRTSRLSLDVEFIASLSKQICVSVVLTYC